MLCPLQAITSCRPNAGVAKKVQKFYEKFVDFHNIKTVFDLKAGHTFVRSYYTFKILCTFYVELFLNFVCVF